DIQNNAKMVASEFLSARAQNGSVVNEAFQYDEQGQYQEIHRYDAAIMQGGTGNADTNGVGIFVEADKKVINTASAIVADGEVHVHGTEGVVSKSAHCTYVNDKWDKHEGFFGQTHKRGHSTKTDVYNATIQSKRAKNVIHSEKGKVDFLGTKILAPHGTDIIAKEDVNLLAMKFQDQRIERKNEFGGLKLNRDVRNDERAAETVVVTIDETVRVLSETGYVNAKGARFLGTEKAKLIIKGKKDVILKEEKLKHSVHTESKGIGFDAPGMKMVEGAKKGNLREGLINEDPLLQTMREANKANNNVEMAAGAFNVGVEGATLYNQFKEGDVANGLLNRYAKASVNYSEEKSDMKYESRGPGGIKGFGQMQLESEEGNVLLGMDVDVNNASIKAKKFIQEATVLDSSFTHEKNTVSAGISPAGTSYGVSHDHSKSKDANHVNNSFRVAGHLEVNADEWQMNGANAEVGSLGGHVKQLIITDLLDEHSAKGESYGANTDGTFSVGNINEKSRRVNQSSGLVVREGVNKEDGPQFTAEKTIIIGAGNISSEGQNNYSKVNPNIEHIALNEYDRAESYNVSLNPSALAEGKATQIQLGVHHKDFHATLDEYGRKVQNEEEYRVKLHIPITEREQAKPAEPNEHTSAQVSEELQNPIRGDAKDLPLDAQRAEEVVADQQSSAVAVSATEASGSSPEE
ncbi:MAG: hemagglutinin repeat-containing protein, partial [Pseudomonadota bacterium]|nr:hemagglutinin repeat-containing protein [Pseudomonadota bacterium]